MKLLLERLKEKRPLLADGAMGTLLHARGIPMDDCFERCNLTRPALISEIHRAYIQAGADIIETNTFGANRFKLTEFGLEDQVAEVNRKGVELALAAVKESGRDVYVAASVGPLGIGVQPYGRLKPEEARAVYVEQIGILAQAGANAILFETFTDLTETLLALEAAREIAPGLPVICEMTFGHEDRTLTGHLPGNVARKLHEAGADVIGVNCSAGPGHITRILQLMKQAAPDAIFSAMPNAGFPETIGGRTMYPATVEYFAEYALTAKAIGATIIGGCCGTTPDHIAAMRAALDDHSRPLPHVTTVELHGDEEHVAAELPSELALKLANDQFIVSVEMKPPRSHNFDRILESARMLTEAGADVLNIADSPAAQMRVSPWAVANLLQNRLGAETVLHFPTRGRNLLRVQGDLLGAHALGLRNIFVCMGDPTRIGDYPDANDNYDIVPSGLIKLISQRMNHGVDQAGNSIGQPTSFTVGCALNMGADDPIKEIDVLRKKIEAGANFALSQAVFEPQIAENFLKRYAEIEGHPLELPVLMGVMPLYSLKHARFLDNEIPGINIPPALFQRIEDAGEGAALEGVRIAQELLRAMKDLVRGVYIIPAYGRYELAAQVIEAVAVA
ncbi:MAG TPA: bifunctional homocysteine S-methyltransferase/methylenetetrahydrofolate reductase [Phototrophicaceae bacterium]|nr:bifunctional homocysteine S-methyltransferase/methylenetetrahydrofolate reductase [Phototrophicaceae bacterium]